MTTATDNPMPPGELVAKCPFCGKLFLTPLGMFVTSDPEDPRAAKICHLPDVCDCDAAKYTTQQQNAQEEANKREKQKKEEISRWRARWEASGMPEAWLDRGLKRFLRADAAQEAAYDAAVVFGSTLLAGATPQSLYVVGDIGAGKTFLSSCLCADLLRKGRRIVWRNVSDVLREIRACYNSSKAEKEDAVIARFTKPPVLVLDDLGKERPTEWAMEQLFSIINARYDANKPLIVTTNYGGAELVKRLTPRPDASGYADDTTARAIVDRLRGMSKLVMLEGASRRG